MTLHGVSLETQDDSAMVEMAEAFIDEYARLGFDENRILHMFDTKGYAGPYMATTALGKPRIRAMVKYVLARWGGRRAATAAAQPMADRKGISLTVLDGCTDWKE
jgi:hypothetical protein